MSDTNEERIDAAIRHLIRAMALVDSVDASEGRVPQGAVTMAAHNAIVDLFSVSGDRIAIRGTGVEFFYPVGVTSAYAVKAICGALTSAVRQAIAAEYERCER